MVLLVKDRQTDTDTGNSMVHTWEESDDRVTELRWHL